MFEVIVQMGGLILCGIGWRWLKPGGLEPVPTRKVLTSVVYHLLLPALVLSVLWKADLDSRTLLIALCGVVAVVLGLVFSLLSCRVCKTPPAVGGAVILAATFPNVTYLGLPVLEATFGTWARSVAVQIDLFACTPLLFTVGVLVASRYGTARAGAAEMMRALFRIPALWAALAGVALNLGQVPLPAVMDGFLTLLERGVVPLMLFSLGLSLAWNREQLQNLPTLIPVVLIRLFLVPALVTLFATGVGLEGDYRTAVILETAMPSMVLGLVFCDHYGLDVGLYATAVTLTTALSLLTLPMWFAWLA